jgi:hypothetical protein
MPLKVSTACCVFLFGASAAFADDMLERSRASADEFQQQLGDRLKSAMAEGGPLAAIEVCAQVAPEIAARASADANAVGARYPEDRAIGFDVGELRGAFVINWSIKEEESP